MPDTIDEIETMAMFGLWPGAADAPLASDIGQLKTQWTAAQLAIVDWRADRARHQSNPKLSPEGKADAVQAAATKHMAKAKELRARLPAFQKARDRMLSEDRLIEPDGWQKVLEYMQLAERRAGLSQMDPLARDLVLLEAAQAGDRLTLEAARQAPPWQPMATPERIAELDQTLLEATSPSKAAELAEVDAGLAAVEQAIAAVEDAILGDLEPVDDPIAAMAAE